MDATVSPPSSIWAWLPWLWSRVLFPGPSSAAGERPRLSALLLLLLPGLLLYPCLGFRLFEPDESRYAQIPAEMLHRGDFIVPTLQGEPYLDKPPLLYWLVAASYRLFGVHDWSARLVPALSLHLTLLAVYLLGRRTLGERPAWWGALFLALAPCFVGMARLLLLDSLLTLWTTLALFAAFESVRRLEMHRGWWIASAVCCGLGVLTKGPVALLLLVPVLFLHRALSGEGARPGWRGWALYLAVVLAVALPWYILLAVRIPAFAVYFLWEHNVQRFLSPAMHVRGVWFYGPVLALVLLPGSLFALSALRFLTTSDEAVARLRSPELGFHLIAGGWCVLFFTLSACKLPTYILPALPFFALVLGYVLVHGGWRSSRLPGVLAGAGFVVMLFLHYLALPWYANYRSPMSRPAEVLSVCADPDSPLVCYPRNCDSIAFYLQRSDLVTFRSKDIEELRLLVRTRPRTVILCTHRHSLQGLRQLLPPEVKITREVRMGLADIPGVPRRLMKLLAGLMGETAMGLSDLAVVEAPGWRAAARDLAAATGGNGRPDKRRPRAARP
jgi:4-amino-4-deoxy-L-arabinose transferase-like glycosyltransferase